MTGSSVNLLCGLFFVVVVVTCVDAGLFLLGGAALSVRNTRVRCPVLWASFVLLNTFLVKVLWATFPLAVHVDVYLF